MALTVFLAPLATGRRVLWLGDASTGAPERLASYAASVRVLDTSGRGRRRRGAAKVSVYRPGPLTFDAGSFDLAVIPDVTVLEDTAATLAEIAPLLGDGLVVAGAPTGREEATVLRAHLGAAFREVRLLGQAPFRGFALADLSAEIVGEVVLDASLLGTETEEVERLYGVAADELPQLDGYTVVQVDGSSQELRATAVDREAPRDESVLEDALAARSREVEALRDALERAESRLEQAQVRLVATEGELAEARASLKSSSDEGDIDRLEAHLKERGARVRELETECERRAALVRDLSEELVEHRLGRRAPSPPSPGQALDVAAAQTEAELERDELRMQLLEERESLESISREHAQLAGRARGLAARLAETAELREIAEARLRVVSLDLDARSDEVRRLEAKAAETREQLELAMIRARGPVTSASTSEGDPELQEQVATLEASERRLSARVGQLSGQLLAARELATQATSERDRARAETLRLTAQVSTLETRMEGLRIGYEMRIAMLGAEIGDQPVEHPATGSDEAIERELLRVSDELEALQGEREGLRLRLADREAALAAAQSAPSAGGVDALDAADRLRGEVASLRAESGELTLRLAEVEESRAEEAARARDLAQAIASRDALVTRLQMDLAEEERSHRIFEEQLTRANDEVTRLREAVVGASEAVDAQEAAEAEAGRLRDQLTELEQRLTAAAAESTRIATLEAELQTARETLKNAEAAARGERDAITRTSEQERESLEASLAEARSQAETHASAHSATLAMLREARKMLDAWRADAEGEALRSEITAVGMESPEGDGRFGALEREVADKDTLLRSLTAQLEERDDRIRALERRVAESGTTGDMDVEAMRQMLLELEERSSRLQEELAHERAARSSAERDLAEVARRPEPDAELERLRRLVREREGALEEALSRASVFERDISSLRGVVSETRHGLEALLGDATSAGDPTTAERLGALLSLLGGF